MQLFIGKGMRGGISYIAHRYAKANNKYMSGYNPGEENSYLMYSDANNLYGWAMSQPLPTGDFQWTDPEEIEFFNYHEYSDEGVILEVDLEYPEELHNLHNDCPCAPEKMCITDDMLSDYCSETKNQHKISSGTVPKIITSLKDKTKYVLHCQNLKLYLDLGLKVKNKYTELKNFHKVNG